MIVMGDWPGSPPPNTVAARAYPSVAEIVRSRAGAAALSPVLVIFAMLNRACSRNLDSHANKGARAPALWQWRQPLVATDTFHYNAAADLILS